MTDVIDMNLLSEVKSSFDIGSAEWSSFPMLGQLNLSYNVHLTGPLPVWDLPLNGTLQLLALDFSYCALTGESLMDGLPKSCHHHGPSSPSIVDIQHSPRVPRALYLTCMDCSESELNDTHVM